MIGTLIVDDDEITGQRNAQYVERVSGFTVIGIARCGREALQLVARGGIDLLLLDIRMPDMTGLEVLQRLAATGANVDTIIVSSVRDMSKVTEAMRLGVVHYLLKPFTFSGFRTKLEEYAAFRRTVQNAQEAVSQKEIDALFSALRPAGDASLPKTLAMETLRQVADCLAQAGEALTAEELGSRSGIARVSARRYLDYLVEAGQAKREPTRTGQAGRPLLRYRWISIPDRLN